MQTEKYQLVFVLKITFYLRFLSLRTQLSVVRRAVKVDFTNYTKSNIELFVQGSTQNAVLRAYVNKLVTKSRDYFTEEINFTQFFKKIYIIL